MSTTFALPLTRRARKGFGLLEVILVFALVIGAGAVVFSVYQSAQARAEIAHDRELMSTLAGNLMTIFNKPWDANNGPAVQDAYYAHPATLGGPQCSVSDHSPGCWSETANAPLGVGEVDSGMPGAVVGVAFTVGFTGYPQGITIAQCVGLLSGGPQSVGGVAALVKPGEWHQAKTDIPGFCASGDDGTGHIADLEIAFGHFPWPIPA